MWRGGGGTHSVLRKGDLPETQAFRERRNAGLEEVYDYCFRWEFQGRGTIHVHVLAWAKLKDDDHVHPRQYNGASNDKTRTKSPMLVYLEDLFHASIDVQCGDGEHNLLRYVTGYVSKALLDTAFRRVFLSSGNVFLAPEAPGPSKFVCSRKPSNAKKLI